eukprot:COSAG04_NODE_18903_length_430_cov_0.555891_1_plen_91_part_10
MLARAPLLLTALALCAASDRVEPPMGPGRRARLASRAHQQRQRQPQQASDPPPLPTWITVNPLKDLPPLPKVHYNNEGIDGSYIAGNNPPT